jgi:hypothetical protein
MLRKLSLSVTLCCVATAASAQALPASCSVFIKATSVCMAEAADQVAARKPAESKTLVRPDYTSIIGSMLREKPDPASYCASNEATDVIIDNMKGLAAKYGIEDGKTLVTDDCRAAMRPLISQVMAAHPTLVK